MRIDSNKYIFWLISGMIGLICLVSIINIMKNEVLANLISDEENVGENLPEDENDIKESDIEESEEINNKMSFDLLFYNNFAFRENFLDGYGGLNFYKNGNNGVVRLKNSHLMKPMERLEDGFLLEEAEKVKRVSNLVEKEGIPFAFVLSTSSISPYDEQWPYIEIVDYTNSNIESFLDDLSGLDIEYIDLQEEFYNKGLNQYDLMFRTDHHWTMEGGFEAYCILHDYVEEELELSGEDKSIDSSEYQTRVYEDVMLGSCGQRTGKFYAKTEDFEYWSPKNEVQLFSVDEGKTMTYDEIWLDESMIEEFAQTPDYVVRLFGDKMKHYINENAYYDKKVLFLSDSMGLEVAPYFLLAFKDVNLVYTYRFDDDGLESILQEYQPDIVIMLESPYQLNEYVAYPL